MFLLKPIAVVFKLNVSQMMMIGFSTDDEEEEEEEEKEEEEEEEMMNNRDYLSLDDGRRASIVFCHVISLIDTDLIRWKN